MIGVLRSVRRPVGAILLGTASVSGAGSLTVVYALASWPSGEPKLALALLVLLGGSVGCVAGGAVAWGGRRRVVIGRVVAAAGGFGATIALTTPFVMRTEAWRAAGGPTFNLVHLLGFLGACGVTLLVGGVLVATADRPPAEHPSGPAPIRPR